MATTTLEVSAINSVDLAEKGLDWAVHSHVVAAPRILALLARKNVLVNGRRKGEDGSGIGCTSAAHTKATVLDKEIINLGAKRKRQLLSPK